MEIAPLTEMANLPFEIDITIFRFQMKELGLRKAKPFGPKLST